MKNRLKEIRGERRISQEKLGAMVGVSRQTIISIEKGKYCPSLPLAFKISETLGLKIEQIFFP